MDNSSFRAALLAIDPEFAKIIDEVEAHLEAPLASKSNPEAERALSELLVHQAVSTGASLDLRHHQIFQVFLSSALIYFFSMVPEAKLSLAKIIVKGITDNAIENVASTVKAFRQNKQD